MLRAEKGYLIIGQETDGTVTPQDLGMGWMVVEGQGRFVGRALASPRPDTARPDRKQLVGCCRTTRTRSCPRAPSSCGRPGRAASRCRWSVT